MKKTLHSCLYLLLALFLLSGCSAGTNTAPPSPTPAPAKEETASDIITRLTGLLSIDLEGSTVLEQFDTHSSLSGKGCIFVKLSFAQAEDGTLTLEEKLENSDLWSALPMNPQLMQAFKQSQDNQKLYGDDSGVAYLPTLKKGRYFFRNRGPAKEGVSEEDAFIQSAEKRFTVALYDPATKILFYYSVD